MSTKFSHLRYGLRALVRRPGLSISAVAALALGIGLAALVSRALNTLLFNVRPWDPTIFAAVVAALALAGLVACVIPANRATRTQPVDALRYD